MLKIDTADVIRSFKCPTCQRVILIEPKSRKYISIVGQISFGESELIFKESTVHEPARICANCFANIMQGIDPRSPDIVRPANYVSEVPQVAHWLKN